MNCFIPSKLGLVFDPSTPSGQDFPFVTTTTRFLSHICDQLLIYDCILLRCDFDTINLMYRGVTCDELEPLFINNKIQFFAPVSTGEYSFPKLDKGNSSIDNNFTNRLAQYLKPFEGILTSSINDIVNQVESYSVENQVINTDLSKDLFSKFLNSFHKDASKLVDYEWKHWHEIGFKTGAAKILDIWSTGIFNIHFDLEMEFYLKRCTSLHAEYMDKLENPLDNIIDSLHSIGNLPSIKDHIMLEQIGTKDFVKLVLSDEVHDLQTWLRENITPGLDVRDFYYASLKKLPSKSNWVKWMRFGSATALSFVLGLFVSGNPVLSALFGVGVGATDTACGDKVTELLLDPYHPKDYIGYFTDKL